MTKTPRVSKAPKYIKSADLHAMSSEELQIICAERNTRNKLSVNADRALQILRERSGAAQWDGIPKRPPKQNEEDDKYDPLY